MKNKINIHCVGGMRSGKTFLADSLFKYGYSKMSLATVIKEVHNMYKIFFLKHASGSGIDVTKLFSKEFSRECLQKQGDIYKKYDKAIYAKLLSSKIIADGNFPVIIDDSRFMVENEILGEQLRSVGVKLVCDLDTRIERYGSTRDEFKESVSHVSEQEWKNIQTNYIIDTTGPYVLVNCDQESKYGMLSQIISTDKWEHLLEAFINHLQFYYANGEYSDEYRKNVL